MCCLWHRLSEDVSRRTDRIYPLAHKPDAQVRPCLRWSLSIGEKRVFAAALMRIRFYSVCVSLLCMCCSGKQSCSCSERLSMLIQLWLIRWLTLNSQVCNLFVTDQLILLCFFLPMLRHSKDTASNATCWASSCRPSRMDWAFPKSSWIQLTAWQHTGNSGQGRCVFLCVLFD